MNWLFLRYLEGAVTADATPSQRTLSPAIALKNNAYGKKYVETLQINKFS